VQRSLVLLVFLLSGAAGLIYQVVWTRRLALMLGVTFPAISTVLAVFMAGLALGSWWLGRRADATRSPLRLYGLLELGVAASGAASPWLLDRLGDLYVHFAREGGMPEPLLGPLRVLVAAAVMLVPTTLMGGTLPVLIRGVHRTPSRIGREAGLLYAVNTLGALLGTLAAAFVLVQSLGITGALYAAAALNLCAGAVALALARGERAAAAPAPDLAAAAPPADPATARAVVLAFGASGALALAYEVMWTRYLVYVVGENSVYAFALILAAFLSGIVLGSWIASRLADRLADLVGVLGAVIALVGATALATVLLTGIAWNLLPVGPQHGFLEASFRRLLRCLLVLIVPTTLSGSTFAIVARLVARDPARLGQAAGRAYALNTFGGILGAIAAGFVILPRLGLVRGLLLLAALNLAVGLALVLRRRPQGRDWGLAAVLGISAVCGAATLAAQGNPVVRALEQDGIDVLFFEDGPEATIAVARYPSGERFLVVDGDAQASTDPYDQVHLRLLGHLPALLHPDPRDALVVGFGAGLSTGSLAQHPGVHVDVAELNRAVIRGSEHFAAWNHDAARLPNVTILFRDGRNHLLTTARRYDVITSDPTDPDDAGITNLYSREYFELLRSRLREGGLVSQWLPTRFEPEAFQLVVRTFQAVFPDASLWRTGYSAVIVGSKGAPRVGRAELARRLEDPQVRAGLAQIGIESPDDLLALYLGGPDGVRAFAGEGPYNTDDRPRVEYLLPRSRTGAALSAGVGERLFALRSPDLAAWFPGWTPADTAALAPAYQRMSALLERNMVLRTRLEQDDERGVESGEPRRRHEADYRRYLEQSFELLAEPLPRIALIEAGLGLEPRQADGDGDALRRGLEAWQARDCAAADRAFRELEARSPELLRPRVLEAGCRAREGDAVAALAALLEVDARAHGQLVELELWRLAEGALYAVFAALDAADAADARALGTRLAALLPASARAPGAAPLPAGEGIGDAEAWRSWWRETRSSLGSALYGVR
jgi:spermidine synthase